MDRSIRHIEGRPTTARCCSRLTILIVIGVVAGPSGRFPADPLPDLYRARIRERHLDVGPGTGYLIDHSGHPDGSHITIVDPNPNVLRHATRRLHRLNVTAVEADVLKPLPVDGPFDSAALSLVIHCLPGPLTRKAAAIANIAAVLAPTACSSVLRYSGRSGQHTWLGRRVLAAFNRRGAFDNLDDSAEGPPRDPGRLLRETWRWRRSGPSCCSPASKPRTA